MIAQELSWEWNVLCCSCFFYLPLSELEHLIKMDMALYKSYVLLLLLYKTNVHIIWISIKDPFNEMSCVTDLTIYLQ